jgi:DNA-binding YbaB/EbfC family protein
MQQILKQAQKMQQQIAQVQEELDAREYTAASGGGMVTARVNGKKEVLELTIQPQAVDPDDVEMLQDLVIAAVNEALRTAEETASQEMNKITGGLPLGL